MTALHPRRVIVIDSMGRSLGLAMSARCAEPYQGRYSVERVAPSGGAANATYTVSGKHCESDKLFEDVSLPSDLKPGDLVQVLCTGAYNSSMASNYNQYPRPATALIRPNGEHCLVQRRDDWGEMLARESIPKDLGG